jgi:hypothetical protein
MKFEQINNAVRLTLSNDEAERISALLRAIGGIATISLEMGVIEQALKLAAKVLENRKEVPVMVLKEAVIVDLILRMGLEESDAEAPTRKTKKPSGSARESGPAPVPGTSL